MIQVIIDRLQCCRSCTNYSAVCNRIRGVLDAAHPADQAGFRCGFCCDGHLLTIMKVWEKRNEFNLPLWVAAIDFSKAFDCVEHASIWKALDGMGVPRAYIKVMTKLYADQTGVAVTDKESKTFSTIRGTKQGDPSSPIIFNALLENVIVDVQAA